MTPASYCKRFRGLRQALEVETGRRTTAFEHSRCSQDEHVT
jgi:hypothetical protein